MNQDIQSVGQEAHAEPHSILRDLSVGDGLGGGGKRRLNSYALVIGFVIVAGGVSIATMRHLGLKAGFDLSGTNLKYSPSATVSAASFERVIHTLESSASPPQVPSEAIMVDPFRPGGGPASREDRSLAEADKIRQRALEEERRKAADRARLIETRLGNMKVVSIMGGRRPLANIGGKLVQVGDVIDDLFTVVAIESNHVVVECDGARHTLSMGESQFTDDPLGRKPGN